MQNKKAFTLAEIIVVIVILGLTAMIVLPPLVRKQIENAKRVKLKRIMEVYDYVLNKITVENGIIWDKALNDFASENDCENFQKYFKIVEGSGCRFKTADGVWWDISDIQNVIVGFNEDDLTHKMAKSDSNRAFYLLSWFDQNGSLRVDDLAAALGMDKDAITRLFDYINSKTTSSNSDTPKVKTITPYTSCINNYCIKYDKYGNMIAQGVNCHGNDIESCEDKAYNHHNYDGKGNLTGENCNEEGKNCSRYYAYDGKGNQTAQGWSCQGNDIGSCNNKYYYAYDDKGNKTGEGCNPQGKNCSYYYAYDGKGNQTGSGCNEEGKNCSIYNAYDGKGNQTAYGWNCQGNDIGSCKYKYYYAYDDKGNRTGEDCNPQGKECQITYTITYDEE